MDYIKQFVKTIPLLNRVQYKNEIIFQQYKHHKQKEILQLYKKSQYLIKDLYQERLLQRETKIKEIQTLFRNCKNLQDIQQIEDRIKLCKYVIDKIEKKEWETLPTFHPRLIEDEVKNIEMLYIKGWTDN